jgi:hypothetical protein
MGILPMIWGLLIIPHVFIASPHSSLVRSAGILTYFPIFTSLSLDISNYKIILNVIDLPLIIKLNKFIRRPP